MANVEYRQATCTYPGMSAPAVDSLDLVVEDGEFMVLVGPSGSGKSTALRMLAGLEMVSSGEILIGDRVVTGAPPKARDIAMVFQSYALYPHLSVRDNLAFPLKQKGVSEPERGQRVLEAARLLELEPLLNRRPRQLSGGQRQRVAMGRAIVRQPQAFLMDEPLSNLDAKLRVQTRAEIARLHQRLKATMIYVTHDQVEAMTMADRIAVINEGVLQQVGTPKELYEQPNNRFVAGFIGSPSMNFVELTVEAAGGSRLVGDGAQVVLDDAQKARLRDLGLATTTVGFRPEHLKVGEPEGPGLRLSAKIDVVEFLGNDELIHAVSEGKDVVAIVQADVRLAVGDNVVLSAAPRHVYLFNPQTELSLSPG